MQAPIRWEINEFTTITSNAIGWNLNDEFYEIQRVMKPGGHSIHLLQAEEKVETPFHKILTSAPWNYTLINQYG